jgi:hypothetical protein
LPNLLAYVWLSNGKINDEWRQNGAIRPNSPWGCGGRAQ